VGFLAAMSFNFASVIFSPFYVCQFFAQAAFLTQRSTNNKLVNRCWTRFLGGMNREGENI